MNGLSESVISLLTHPEVGRWQAALLLTRTARQPANWPLNNHVTVIDSSLVVRQANFVVRAPLFFDGAQKTSLADTSEGVAPDLALAVLNSLFGEMEVRAPINLSRYAFIQALERAVGAKATWSYRSDFANGDECEAIDLGPNASVAFQTNIPREGTFDERGAAWADALVTGWLARAVFVRAFSARFGVGEGRSPLTTANRGAVGEPAKSRQ